MVSSLGWTELLILLIGIPVVFLLLRWVMWWYWGIHQHLTNQRTIIELLKKIADQQGENLSPAERSPADAHLPATPSATPPEYRLENQEKS